jgi:hypothetical protein
VVKRLPSLCGASPRHHPAHTAPHLVIRYGAWTGALMKCVSQGGEWSGRGYPGTVGTPASHLVSPPHAQEQTDRVRTLRGEETPESVRRITAPASGAHGAAPRYPVTGRWTVGHRREGRGGVRLPPRGAVAPPPLRWPLDPRKGRRRHTALGPAGTPPRPCPGHNELALDSGLQVSCARIHFAPACPPVGLQVSCSRIQSDLLPRYSGAGFPPLCWRSAPPTVRAGRFRSWRRFRHLRRPFSGPHVCESSRCTLS